MIPERIEHTLMNMTYTSEQILAFASDAGSGQSARLWLRRASVYHQAAMSDRSRASARAAARSRIGPS